LSKGRFAVQMKPCYPALFTKKIGCGQGVSEMVAEKYLSTLSKPFPRQRSPHINFAVRDNTIE